MRQKQFPAPSFDGRNGSEGVDPTHVSTTDPDAALVAVGKTIARSPQARRDRRRRQTLIEDSFAEAANEHGFKRSRWRRLWRQEILDWLIAAVQNVKLLVKAGRKKLGGATAATELGGEVKALWRRIILPMPVWPG